MGVKVATLYKRKGGWSVRIRRKGSLPISKQFKTKEDARKWARKVERLVELGKYEDTTEAGMTTLGQALERYISEKLIHNKNAKPDEYRIAKILRHSISTVSLAELTSGKLSKFRNEIALETSNSSANRYITLICGCIRTIIQEWDIYIPTNPCKNIRKLKEPAPVEDRISPTQEESILEHATRTQVRELPCIIVIAIELGLRRSEILNLRWEHVKENAFVLVDTKNNETRTVPITNRVKAELSKIPRNISGNVFAGVTIPRFTRAWSKCLELAGVDTTFHRLRHEACSRMNDKGFTIPEICAISGHKTWSVLKRYTHIKVEHLQEKLNA
jgi:integrase